MSEPDRQTIMMVLKSEEQATERDLSKRPPSRDHWGSLLHVSDPREQHLARLKSVMQAVSGART